MLVSFRINPALPRLAWMAEVERQNLAVTAIFGRCVEHGPDFAVAGVWNGRFGDGAFETTDCFFGTGLVIRDGAVTFVSSAALTDAIYYTESDGRLVAANSLPLLLAATEDRLDPGFAYYDRMIDSHLAGINRYEKLVPTLRGSVRRVFCRNLRVTASGTEEIDKRRPPAFPDYASYLRYLTQNYASIYRNIREPERRYPLDIISTQSRGYDTTAVNTIASKHEVDAVFTIAEPAETDAFAGTVPPSRDSDDGTDICAALGLKATRLDRRLFARAFDEEHLFYSTIHYADAAAFLGLKPHLGRGSVMLTGQRGDAIWGTDKYYRTHPQLLIHHSGVETDISPEMLSGDFPSTDLCTVLGLSEVGVEWGLIQVVPTFIGQTRSDLFRITMSEEMAPWRLGDEYDRPIPRRIAEEIGGVPRDFFGQKKMAAVTRFPFPPVPIGAELRREYFGFLRQHRIVSPFWPWLYRWVHRINSRIYYAPWGHYRYVYYIRRFLSKLAGRDIEIPLLYRRLNGRLYCFCVNKRVNEYEDALRGDRFDTRHDGSSAAADGRWVQDARA